MTDSPAPHRIAGIPKDGVATAAANVERVNLALAAQAGLPDGPNVGPSPQEHLAAQGRVGATRPSAATDTGASPASEPPQSPEPEASPEEQELVDEQINSDRQASKNTDPSMP